MVDMYVSYVSPVDPLYRLLLQEKQPLSTQNLSNPHPARAEDIEAAPVLLLSVNDYRRRPSNESIRQGRAVTARE